MNKQLEELLSKGESFRSEQTILSLMKRGNASIPYIFRHIRSMETDEARNLSDYMLFARIIRTLIRNGYKVSKPQIMRAFEVIDPEDYDPSARNAISKVLRGFSIVLGNKKQPISIDLSSLNLKVDVSLLKNTRG